MRLLLLLSVLTQAQAIMKFISVYGLEVGAKSFVCSWIKPVEWYIEALKDLGFNGFRLPFSYEYVMEGNFDLMDRFVDSANYNKMPVLLDYHRTWSAYQGSVPTDGITMDEFVECWLTVLRRYKDKQVVRGLNSYNEYQGNDPNEVNYYSKYLFDRVEEEFGDRFSYYMTGTGWAGNLTGVSLEGEPYANRTYYSVHKYSWSGTADEADWENSFGNIGLPVDRLVVGEFGFFSSVETDVDWAKRFIVYLKKKGIRNTAFWTVAHSMDTGGIFYDDCLTVDWKKLSILKDLWSEDRQYLRSKK
jgi:aryl-phospho-beta-D-glucosidase BglC (GH1 family)